MIELSVNNLMKYYGANQLFQNISFEIQSEERIGLIGQNGSGKTTIMKILMGYEDYQGGTISLKKGNKMGYLNQIPNYEEGTTTLEVLHMAFEEMYLIQKQMREMEIQMEILEGTQLEKAVLNYSKLIEQYEHGGGYDIEIKVNKITEGLAIDEKMKDMLFENLSGGEKTRVILGKILLEEPDILLLDEPTNHLDLTTIEWLEGFLKEYKGAALIISHDRYFLDSVVNKIIELDRDHVDQYLGNYSYYVVEKERRFLLELKNYENQQKKIDRMEKQIERYRIWGVMRDSDKMFRRAKELEKRLEKIEVLKRPVEENRKIRLSQTMVGRSGKRVLEICELSKAFGEKELFKDVNLSIFYQDSACIIGANGSGKTTFLRMLLGEIESDTGSIRLGAQVKLGYLAQQVEFVNEEQTILEYFCELHNITYGEARNQLAKVLFLNDDVNKKIKNLSGGEKSRLKLCSLTFKGVNLLILDEPTNHLDIDSREVLEETLLEFEGTILFVSHDRYFINKIADKILVLEEETIKEYNGDYQYYQEEYQKAKERRDLEEKLSIHNTKTKSVQMDHGRKLSKEAETKESKNNDRRERNKSTYQLDILERSIQSLEDQSKDLENKMNLYASDIEQLSALYIEKEKLDKELENLYSKWEILQYES